MDSGADFAEIFAQVFFCGVQQPDFFLQWQLAFNGQPHSTNTAPAWPESSVSRTTKESSRFTFLIPLLGTRPKV